ncbi:MAG TPA: pilus assembly protein CpaE [Actinomycetes bacterium]|jgi:hypothetical protein
MSQPVVSIDLARELREAGLQWTPARGDHFVVVDRGMDDDLFVLSDMTIEVQNFATGPVIGFNGTTEWALDSLDMQAALWLPTEGQLRSLLGATLRRLERTDSSYVVTVVADGEDRAAEAATAPNAYARALLDLAPERLR